MRIAAKHIVPAFIAGVFIAGLILAVSPGFSQAQTQPDPSQDMDKVMEVFGPMVKGMMGGMFSLLAKVTAFRESSKATS